MQWNQKIIAEEKKHFQCYDEKRTDGKKFYVPRQKLENFRHTIKRGAVAGWYYLTKVRRNDWSNIQKHSSSTFHWKKVVERDFFGENSSPELQKMVSSKKKQKNDFSFWHAFWPISKCLLLAKNWGNSYKRSYNKKKAVNQNLDVGSQAKSYVSKSYFYHRVSSEGLSVFASLD